MIKETGAFRTIGELSKELKIKPHILRYWEDQFTVLNPLKRAGQRRHYRPEDVAMVRTINRLLNEEGYTVKGARKYLSSRKNRGEAATLSVASGSVASGSAASGSAASETAPPISQTAISEKAGAPVPGGDNGFMVSQLRIIRQRLVSALEQA